MGVVKVGDDADSLDLSEPDHLVSLTTLRIPSLLDELEDIVTRNISAAIPVKPLEASVWLER
jgi:hypothetical protein